MALEDLSLGELYLGWTLAFCLILGPAALFRAPNDFWSIFEYLAAAGGVAALLGAWFAVPMWIVIEVAR